VWTMFGEPWFDCWQRHGAFPSPNPSHSLCGPPSLVLTGKQGFLHLKYSGRSIKQNIVAVYMYFNIITFPYSLASIFYQFIYSRIPVLCCNLCISIVMPMHSYCMIMYLHRASWHSSATLTEVSPYIFLSCKVNARV
jgi:hypothetical protein